MQNIIGATIAILARAVLPIYFTLFKKIRRGHIETSGLKPPYLLVSNHQATMDPFYINVMLPGTISFLATDMLFRIPFMNFLMTAIGSIPKSKFVSDASSIRLMLRKVKSGKPVGIFPEGQRCVAGFTDRMVPGVGKLAKLMDVQVVAARLEGGFFADPRWALKKRKGASTVNLKLLLTKEQVRSLPVEQIEEIIKSSISHSDYDWIKSHPEVRYKGKDKALGLHNVMFICPQCESFDSFSTEEDTATCRKCGYSIAWGDRGEFILKHGSRLHYGNLQEQEMWQRAKMDELVSSHLSSKPAGSPLFGPFEVTIRKGTKAKPLQVIGEGMLSLHDDGLLLATKADCPEEYKLKEIEGFTLAGIKGKHHRIIEFMHLRKSLYNLVLHDPYESTYKWTMAVERLQGRSERPD